MQSLRDQSVLVLGLGASGLAMARWCARQCAQVAVWDSRSDPARAAALAALTAQCPAVRHLAECPATPMPAQSEGQRFQLILKSPGLAPHDPLIAPLLQAARETGVAVLGELDLFVHALADLQQALGYAPQVLAITGTNGKTTTTAMTAGLLARAGKRVAMAGNIGPTLLDTLSSALAAAGLSLPSEPEKSGVAAAGEAPAASDTGLADAVQAVPDAAVALAAHTPAHAPPAPDTPDTQPLPDVWVLELSSFQLAGGGSGVRGFEPHAATVLNISQDHLDWHGSLQAYIAAKAQVFGPRTLRVINRDDAAVQALVPAAAPAKGKLKAADRPLPPAVLRFGLDAPRQPGDYGLVSENGMAWLVRALPTDETIKRRKDDPPEEIHLQRLMPADALRVRGRHNAANALAALALAGSTGCTLAPLLHGLREYGGEPHRTQFVGAVDGVEAYDDSKGTNVGATVAALRGLGADKAPARLLVILGGDGKGQDFSPLTEPLRQHARAVATLGRDAAAIEAVLARAPELPVQRHATLPEAVAWCFEQARPGDAVLLSPACASLDMFRDYGHRAEVFVQAVQALAHDRGQL